jgi:predicted solute-binding protein
MTTGDGATVTVLEQEGLHTGQDVGRLWIDRGATWVVYGGFASLERRREVLTQAQAMTARDFATWIRQAAGILRVPHARGDGVVVRKRASLRVP